jgi:hypothetical protein
VLVIVIDVGPGAGVSALFAEPAGDVSEVGQERVGQARSRVVDGGVIDEADQDEVRLLDGVKRTHPIRRETKRKERREFEVPLDHAPPSRLVAFPAALEAFALLRDRQQGELPDLREVGGQRFLF